jgi:general secretion pathway protein C
MAPKAAAASARPGQGVALIAVDGKPPKAFVVGSSLDTNLVLQSVSLRTAAIGPAQGAAAVTLELPPLAAAATGTLPAIGSGAARNPAAPVPAPYVPPAAVPPLPIGQVRPGFPPAATPPGMGGMPAGAMPVPPAGGASIPRDPNPPTATQ